MRQLDAATFVAQRQIVPGDIPALPGHGIRLIVNNRPDGEEPGQPSSAEIDAAARAAGLGYRHLPIAGGLSAEAVAAMAAALAQGPVLAFCRSGTRSTFLWALARAESGDDPAELQRKAAAAGYDLNPIRRFLQARPGRE